MLDEQNVIQGSVVVPRRRARDFEPAEIELVRGRGILVVGSVQWRKDTTRGMVTLVDRYVVSKSGILTESENVFDVQNARGDRDRAILHRREDEVVHVEQRRRTGIVRQMDHHG